MVVNPGDILLIKMSLFGDVWTQNILNLKNNISVSYHQSLDSQTQNLAYFSIEPYGKAHLGSEVVFSETTIAFSNQDALNCQLQQRGLEDFVAAPTSLNNGQMCYVEQMVLRMKAP